MADKILVITGPTASGKTALSEILAEKFGGEIVGADSMQIYRHMDIGTAKPTSAEMGDTPHHMIDFLEPYESYSVSRYVQDASAAVDGIISRGKLPIVVGGTGLYIDSLISGLDFLSDGSHSGVRDLYCRMYDSAGGEAMIEKLSEFDRESAEKLHPNDKKRVVRAFEVYHITGRTISEHNRDTRLRPKKYDALKIALSFKNREDLYSRIDSRVDNMMRLGLEAEAAALLDGGVPPSATAMQAIGYKEMVRYFSGEIDLEEAVRTIKTESRRYAKRQLSWLRRDQNTKWILWDNPPDFESGVRFSTEFLDEFGIIKP